MHGSDGTGGPPAGPRFRNHLTQHPEPRPPVDPFSSGSDSDPGLDDGPGPWFEADHEGFCSGCDEYHIEPGDRIRADGRGLGRYEHEDCASG